MTILTLKWWKGIGNATTLLFSLNGLINRSYVINTRYRNTGAYFVTYLRHQTLQHRIDWAEWLMK